MVDLVCTFRSAILSAALAVAVIASTSILSLAQGTHLWTQSRLDEFEKGTPQGVELTSDGSLRTAQGLSEQLTTPSSFVWSVAVDKSGTAYLGTASPATVLRMKSEKDAKPFTLFSTKDLSVQVVKLGPDGALYAATMPSGKVYRLKTDASSKQEEASATVVFDAAEFDSAMDGKPVGSKPDGKAHYIWDLTFDAAGRLYIATGGPGAIYRIDPSKSGAKPELFFKTDEQHLRSLAWDANENLIAGSDGAGLVYRISPQGKGYVLFESPRREITSVAVAANGTIYAASVGDKSHNPLPPLPIQGSSSGASAGSGTITMTVIQPGSLQAANTSVTIPDGSEIYALTEGQAPRKLWVGKDEIVYALNTRPEGLLALTGNRGRIFRIAEDGSYADVAHLDAQQGLTMTAIQSATGKDEILVGTGNTGKLFCLCATEKHEYASDVLDAGALARFGRIEITQASGYELLTRTGNVEQPARGKKDGTRADWGWSDWQPLKDGVVASPAGRFLQWEAVLHKGGTLGSVGVNYLPVNAAPVVDNLVVVPGARVNPQGQSIGQSAMVSIAFSSSSSFSQNLSADSSSPLQATKDRTAVTVRWVAHDENGDDLTFALFLRGDGETVWRPLKDNLTEKAYSFDAALIPDGGYQIKVVASDAPSHTPGQALTSARESERFEVDTTPPVIAAIKASSGETDCIHTPCKAPIRISFDAEDAFSTLARAEYSLDAGPWQYIEPVGGFSDSKREHYELSFPVSALDGKPAEHLITIRVYDRHDNIGVAKAVFLTPAK
jgi:hypothetical protein